MLHKLVAASCIVGLMAVSDIAAASPIKYDVDLTVVSDFPPFLGDKWKVLGQITTDGALGVIHASNIIDFDLHFGSLVLSPTNPKVVLTTFGDNLTATFSGLYFTFEAGFGDLQISIPSGLTGVQSPTFGLYVDPLDKVLDTNDGTTRILEAEAGTLTLGTAVRPVPLPSSAPLFGVGLIALGAAGYAAKRKKDATAV